MTNSEIFLKNLKSKHSCCYLCFTNGQLSMWNFMAESLPAINTHLLFKAAARVHFDYLFPKTSMLGLEKPGNFSQVGDEKFKKMISAIPLSDISHKLLSEEVLKFFKKSEFKTVLITTSKLKSRVNFKASNSIILNDVNIFGNVEPVWRQIKSRLPEKYDAFILALGEEKFLIGPRLALSFKKPVFDLAVNTEPTPTASHKTKAIVKRVLKKVFPNRW